MRSLIIILLILGSASVLIGGLFKIQQWPFANVFLGGGIITELFCAIALVFRSFKDRTDK